MGSTSVDRVKVSRGVGLNRQIEGPELRTSGRAPRQEKVCGRSGEVADPIGVNSAGQTVAAVVEAPGAQVVDAQRVTAAVTVCHIELDDGGLAGADLEHFAQALAEVRGGLKVHNQHPV